MDDREIGVIIAKLDALHEDVVELKDMLEGHGGRIQSLEKFKSMASGGIAIFLTFASFVCTYVKVNWFH